MFDDQNYFKLLNSKTEQRYQREIEQLRWIGAEMKIHKGPKEARMRYARSVAQFLLLCTEMEEKWDLSYYQSASREELDRDQKILFAEVEPSHYAKSVWNPSFAVKVLGAECGALLSAVCAILQNNIKYAFHHMRFAMHGNHELFLDLFQLLNQDRKIKAEEIQEVTNRHFCEYAKVQMSIFVHTRYDFQNATLRERVESLDWSDSLNLYALSPIVSEEAMTRAQSVNALSEEAVHEMADSLVQDFRRGFFQGGRDILSKKIVRIRYPLGMERLAAQACALFRSEIHYFPQIAEIMDIPANAQFTADHENDLALLFNEEFYQAAVKALEEEYTANHEMMNIHGGEAVFLCPSINVPVNVQPAEEALRPSVEQQAAWEKFQEECKALLEQHLPTRSMSHAEYNVSI